MMQRNVKPVENNDIFPSFFEKIMSFYSTFWLILVIFQDILMC